MDDLDHLLGGVSLAGIGGSRFTYAQGLPPGTVTPATEIGCADQ
jgi:hypothetical protein